LAGTKQIKLEQNQFLIPKESNSLVCNFVFFSKNLLCKKLSIIARKGFNNVACDFQVTLWVGFV